jgi:hypothetical protein
MNSNIEESKDIFILPKNSNLYQISLITEKLFKNSYDIIIKNIILSEVFKYLYIKAIESKIYKIPRPEKLCYLINFEDTEYGKKCLEKEINNLLIIKKKYIADICIYLYKNNKRYFCINMLMNTNKIISISQIH